jgi:hypothetical protein
VSNKPSEALFLSCSDGLKIVQDETAVYKNLLQENAHKGQVRRYQCTQPLGTDLGTCQFSNAL